MGATKSVSKGETSQKFKEALSKGFFLRFMSGSLGIRRKVQQDSIEDLQGTERGMISVSKKIIDCEEYRETQRIYGKIKALLALRAVPIFSDMMKSCYLIHISIWKQTWADLDKLIQAYGASADEFVKVYSKAKSDAKSKLGPRFYVEEDYPPENQVRAAFYTRIIVFKMDTPGELKDADPLAFEVASREMEAMYRRSLEDAKLLLRQTMRDLVGHLADRLSGESEKGKAKIFRDSAIEHVNDFLAYFEPRDINGDKELAGLVTRCKKLMQGVDAKGLRDDEKFRGQMAQQLAAVTGELDKLLIEKPTRAIRVAKKK